jgi:uncharacterized protein YbaR (Trm112 family)
MTHMLDPKLLNILACPECKIDVVYRRVGTKEELECSRCHRIFPIVDGIPQMVPAKKE